MGSPVTTISSKTNLNFPQPAQQAKTAFKNVVPQNAMIPARSMSLSNPERAAGAGRPGHEAPSMGNFQFQRSASITSLDTLLDDGRYQSGFPNPALDMVNGSDGVRRADFLSQPQRRNACDLGGESPAYQLQHDKDINRVLAPLLTAWDEHAAGMVPSTQLDALSGATQNEGSNSSRAHCAREVLTDLGISKKKIDELLQRQASSRGGTAIINACRLLEMDEVKANSQVHASLEKSLCSYLDAAKGDYSGVQRSFASDGFNQLKNLDAAVEACFETIGRSVIEDRMMADSAPALLDMLVRKNPGVPLEALRRDVSKYINPQSFSALDNRLVNANASGYLQDHDVLKQLVQEGDRPKPPPAGNAAKPVDDFVKHLVNVLGAMKPTINHIENNARQIVNQDGWNFQGNKDPRPEKAVEPPSPPLIVDRPEVRDTESQPLVEDVEVTEVVVATTDDLETVVDVEEEVVDVEDNPPPTPPPMPRRRDNGMYPVADDFYTKLDAVLEEIKRPRTLRPTVINAHKTLPAQVQQDIPPVNENDDEASSTSSSGKREVHPQISYNRLMTPIPLGQHAPKTGDRGPHDWI